jgi:hypothetical protein
MDHGVRVFDQRRQAIGPVECAVDPNDMWLIGLGTAGEGAHFVAALARETDQVTADKTRAAGNRKRRQSITI